MPFNAGRVYTTDLHLHSNRSDGIFSPGQLVLKAREAGVNAMALTDHETLAGLAEAEQAASNLGLSFIPGVEINTAGDSEIHILLYHVHPGMAELTRLLEQISQDRQSRAYRFIDRFAELGIHLDIGDFEIPEGTDCNRPLVAKALVRKGIVKSTDEAFRNYLAVGKKAYVPRLRVETIEAIRLARREGAVPVLAHPELIRSAAFKTEANILELAAAGLMGIEAHHSKHSPSARTHWDQMARKLGLLVTGGSDFHEPGDSHGPIGCQTEAWQHMQEDTEALLALKTK